MGSLVGLLNTVGAWDMARRLIEDLLERLGPDAPTRARWLQTLAAFVQRQGDADRASLLDLQAIMTQPNAAQDNTFIGIGFHNQAIIAAQKGMYQFAESQLSMAIWRFEQDDNQPMLANSHLQLSNIVAALGRRGEARDHVEKGLQIFMSLPDCHPERRSGIALAHRNLAGLTSGDGDQEEAERLISIAQEIYTELNERRLLAECLRFRGELAFDDENDGRQENCSMRR